MCCLHVGARTDPSHLLVILSITFSLGSLAYGFYFCRDSGCRMALKAGSAVVHPFTTSRSPRITVIMPHEGHPSKRRPCRGLLAVDQQTRGLSGSMVVQISEQMGCIAGAEALGHERSVESLKSPLHGIPIVLKVLRVML